ncbi:DUF916 domain-containing protein [Candidatus Peregrinibacteria bacterium]|nr:DUF916 domain-containing protein [Candidatus Peregrinibacteria bacterium]
MVKKIITTVSVISFFTLTNLCIAQVLSIGIKPEKTYINTPTPFYHEIKPGDQQKGNILIFNSGQEPIEIEVYAVDSFITNDQKLAYKLINDEQEQVGKWVTFNENIHLLEPGEEKTVEYQIELPENTEYKTYLGGFGIQESNPETIEGTINNVYRYINGISIKSTDNPVAPVEQTPPETNYWPIVYFGASLIITLIAIVVIFLKYKK